MKIKSRAPYIGQRVQRKEDPRLLSGRGQFVDSIVPAGHAARRPCAQPRRARQRPLDQHRRGATSVAGVHAILHSSGIFGTLKVNMINFFLLPPRRADHTLADGRVSLRRRTRGARHRRQ